MWLRSWIRDLAKGRNAAQVTALKCVLVVTLIAGAATTIFVSYSRLRSSEHNAFVNQFDVVADVILLDLQYIFNGANLAVTTWPLFMVTFTREQSCGQMLRGPDSGRLPIY
jgi:hypothetical protein